MTNELEEEMRRALFGPSTVTSVSAEVPQPKPTAPGSVSRAVPTKKSNSRPLSPKLRVTLHVTKEFEGEITVYTYDASTLSTFDAEKQAKEAAKKEKYRYFEVISTVAIG